MKYFNLEVFHLIIKDFINYVDVKDFFFFQLLSHPPFSLDPFMTALQNLLKKWEIAQSI